MEARRLWARASSSGRGWRSDGQISEENRIDREAKRVRAMRARLHVHPKQPLIWAELARSQLILGSDEGAIRSMKCAIQLAPENVYLRRCASRMYLHVDEIDAALSVIRRHPSGRQDPRLVAAEIAISSVAGKPSKYAHLAKALVDEDRFRAQHRSEVAAAIGTVELENGKHKKARDFFEKSLRKPTENALAQVQWASERDSKIVIPENAWSTPCSHEADAMASRVRHDWDGVVESCELWLESEPFASKPAELGSFSAFRIDQAERAYRIATSGLATNHSNILLLNNRAVSSVYLGKIEDGIKDVEKAIRFGGSDDTHLVATLGLIAYRLRMPSLGERYYGTAVAKFVKDKNAESTLLACLYWIREIGRYNAEYARNDLKYVKKYANKLLVGRRDPEIESMMEVIEKEIEQELIMGPVPDENDTQRIESIFEHFSVGRDFMSIRAGILGEMIGS